MRLLRDFSGLRDDLAYLVACGSILRRSARDFCCLRLARPNRISHSSQRGRAHRSRKPEGAPRRARSAGGCRMSIAQETMARDDPYRISLGGRFDTGQQGVLLGAGGHAAQRIISAYGFWIFLLSDIVMFSAFFAAYAVLSGETAGGPSGKQLFNMTSVALQTGCLLLSSFACGVASIGARARKDFMYYGGMTATALL